MKRPSTESSDHHRGVSIKEGVLSEEREQLQGRMMDMFLCPVQLNDICAMRQGVLCMAHGEFNNGLKENTQRFFEAYVNTLPLKCHSYFMLQALFCDGLYRKIAEYDMVGYMGHGPQLLTRTCIVIGNAMVMSKWMRWMWHSK
jgi:hypothetical protein